VQPQQFNPELKAYIDGIMPDIDEAFTAQNIPIHDRFMKAAILFVNHFIESSSFETNDELMKDKAFFEVVAPLFMQWFHEKYGELAKPPQQRTAIGIIASYAQPIKISIPLTTSEPISNDTLWLRFPDTIDKIESIESFFDKKVPLNILNENQYSTLKEEVSELVSTTRTINLNLMAAEGLDVETTSMLAGIWSHFEKAVDDIISFRPERISVGCWELHLAIEKSFKVLIKQKTNKKAFGHNLISLHKKAKPFCPELDISLLESLPTDKDAIELRYAEQSRNIQDALVFYKSALQIVLGLTNKLSRKYKLNNAEFKIKKAPWAI
tara:strand:+ start:3020 stop:3991 length:972 start_codon:yes stop_codon:yes gene_type:complete